MEGGSLDVVRLLVRSGANRNAVAADSRSVTEVRGVLVLRDVCCLLRVGGCGSAHMRKVWLAVGQLFFSQCTHRHGSAGGAATRTAGVAAARKEHNRRQCRFVRVGSAKCYFLLGACV